MQKMLLCLMTVSFLAATLAYAGESTYEIVLAGKTCKDRSVVQYISCEYKVGKGLHFSIDAIGQPDTGITFVKCSMDGDFYATYGLKHGCIIVKRGPKGITSKDFYGPGTPFDYAFVSPKNGKVYRTWQECMECN